MQNCAETWDEGAKVRRSAGRRCAEVRDELSAKVRRCIVAPDRRAAKERRGAGRRFAEARDKSRHPPIIHEICYSSQGNRQIFMKLTHPGKAHKQIVRSYYNYLRLYKHFEFAVSASCQSLQFEQFNSNSCTYTTPKSCANIRCAPGGATCYGLRSFS